MTFHYPLNLGQALVRAVRLKIQLFEQVENITLMEFYILDELCFLAIYPRVRPSSLIRMVSFPFMIHSASVTI